MHRAWHPRLIVFGTVVAVLVAVQVPLPGRTQAAPASAPVTGHPRLFVRAEDLPRLRSWAVPSNPMFDQGLGAIAEQARMNMDKGLVPNSDSGGLQYEPYPTEMYAELFAFMSLISNDPATRNDYAQRARTLLMYVMSIAAQGPAPGQPFRDPCFASCDSNRSRFYGEAFALAADWLQYHPGLLTAADKATIRQVFLRWSEEIVTRSYGKNGVFVPAPGVYNDPSLVQDRSRRWAVNNFYTGHMRNLGLMAMAMDAADDPGNALRNYLRDATGGWLYMTDYVLRNDSRGGLLPEGFEYSPLTGSYIAQLLVALHTAGQDDPVRWGPQVVLASNPFWDDTVAGYLHSLSPRPFFPTGDKAYLGQFYLPANYGDNARYWVLDHVALFGALGVYDQIRGNTARLNASRWIQTHTAPGGAALLTDRARGSDSFFADILYFMLFDPTAPAPADPRPSYAATFFAPGLGRILARTGWDPDATWFTYLLKWSQIDHQLADGNQFEFYRRGEWLTKEKTGYDLSNSTGCTIGSTEYHNTLAVQNTPFGKVGEYYGNCSARGSQWPPYVLSADPLLLAHSSGDPTFVYATGDATNLHNSAVLQSTDVLHVSRSIVWLKPDHIVVYDRAATQTANRFKRFWLNLPAQPSIAGNRAVMTTAAGQQLFVTSLLPAGAALSSDAGDPKGNLETADFEPMTHRLRIEAPSGPATTRFLTVLQGADPGAPPDPGTQVQSSGGTPYSGALVKNTAVLFPVDLTTPFASLTYVVPSTTTMHLITGLTPNASYTVSKQTVGGNLQVVVSPGAGTPADSGGVLRDGGPPPTTPSPTRTVTGTPGGATPTRTLTPTVALASATPTRSPTTTPTPGPVAGRAFTLQAAAQPRLSWQPGTQTSALLIRWSPDSGFSFALLPPGQAAYTDLGPLPDATYCWVLLAYLGDLAAPDVRAISDLLCQYTAPPTGATPPTAFRARLNQSDTATLDWAPPGGQDRYELLAIRFDGSDDRTIELPGDRVSYQEDTAGATTCYRLRALNGAQDLGGTHTVCTAPGVGSIPSSGPADLRGLERLLRLDRALGR